MTTDHTQPLDEESEAPRTEAEVLRKGAPPAYTDPILEAAKRGDLDDDPGDDPEPYGYPETTNDKIHLMNLVTRGQPFVLLTVQGHDEDGRPQVAVDAAGLDLVAAYAITNEVAGALSQQISQLRVPRPSLIVPGQ